VSARQTLRESSSGSHDRFRIRILHLDLPQVLLVQRRHPCLASAPVLLPILIAGLAVGLLTLEMRSSWLEAHLLAAVGGSMKFSIARGTSAAIRFPHTGPYDHRLGYAELPQFVNRVKAFGYQVTAQARDSKPYLLLTRLGLYPIYHEKTQAGLQILDRDGKDLYTAPYPVRVYSNASEIPSLVVNTVLFIENHDLLDPSHPYRNPAVEWSRLGHAVVRYGIHELDRSTPIIGGSTLATQLEKIRHSPQGKTHSAQEKLWQMATASLRAYEGGPQTVAARRQILRDYVNSIPLAASAQGEVTGLGDGLWQWYSTDFAAANRLLEVPGASQNMRGQEQRARVYREVLSLFLATRAPYYYLVQNPKRLARQTDRYLRALQAAGVISSRLCSLALNQDASLHPQIRRQQRENFVADKATDLVRTRLLSLLGVNDVYALDHLDLSVSTTIDSGVQHRVTAFLQRLANPTEVEKENLQQPQLLAEGDPRSVIYSFTLYERGLSANLLRVQTDNYDEPLSINQGTRLQLGSTAKLRTLIEYLQIVEQLHDKLAAMNPARLGAMSVHPDDRLTLWAIQYLSLAKNKSLAPMLEAALNREYSASPDEGFFTASGLHYFANFESSDNSRNLTVSEAFQHSVNLVFIRLMRDIERYYVFTGATTSEPANMDAQTRQRYLARFADAEGKVFLVRFYERYSGQTPDQALETLLRGIHLTPRRLAVIYRSVRPDTGVDQFSGFMRSHLPTEVLAGQDLEKLYAEYGPDKFDLSDRGYLSHIHPLELWLLNYLSQHPHTTLSEVMAHSAPQRQEVYWWLFRTKHQNAQNRRIKIIMEQDAFRHIWRDWSEVGYPFDSLVPSYATAIGVSGDTPAALAELMGIIVNDGVRSPTIIISQLRFAEDTPMETVVGRQLGRSERVLSPEIAELVRRQLIGVVENGTGRRAHGGLVLPDGKVLAIGGKTGTGDNEFKVFDASGHFRGSRAVNRTAAFVFMIGDRFYGTVTAFVPGKNSSTYQFTSALAVQVLKDLEPLLIPMIGQGEGT
jgi:membrane peptidoglycan carboxypeptidase